MWFLGRQIVNAAYAANAVKPVPGGRTAVPAFLAGWLTSELAPQLLVATATDAGLALRRVRREGARPGDRAGLALAALSAGALGWMTLQATRSAARVESTLREGLGDDYLDVLEDPPTADDLRSFAREVLRPFSFDRHDVEVVSDINYTAGGKRARLDVYRPRGVDVSNAPVLVQVHGGAWTLGTKESQGRLLMNRMVERGWVCVAMNYRLAPKHPFPAQVIDVKKAIAWTRENIASYGGDPTYLVITGGSAGGHLASLAALTPGKAEWQPGFEDADTSVAACVPFYGVYDMAGMTELRSAKAMRNGFLAPKVFQKDPVAERDAFVDASPLAHVNADAPDFFCLHGANDSLVDVRQAHAFVEALKKVSRASVTYAEFPGAQHAFEVFGSIRAHHAVRAVDRWLEHHRALWLRERAQQQGDGETPGQTSASA
ncbi:alpha/beta hydrolase [Nocardioides korecus]